MTDALGLGAIVLAAGASTRMGRPKALIRWRGSTFLEHAIERASAAGCDPIVVVTGATELITRPGVVATHNPDWRDGQLSSVQAGIRALLAAALASSPPATACLVLTVDRPAVTQATVDALVAAWRDAPDAVWQPRHEGRSGHPLLYPADLLGALLALSPTSSARELVRSPAVQARRRWLEVDDPGVVFNVDAPSDLDRLGE